MAANHNRPPPAHPGPDAGNSNPRMTGGVQQDLGLHSSVQDAGSASHPQPPVLARPVFYIHAPPPPFLPYQWPTPFSFNPFTGFPGMGYGMVIPPPPLPHPPYVEAPAYILPHPHLQPVDYRRLLHPQVHSQAASNQNQPRRVRPHHNIPFRETINSEVQTELTQMGIGDVRWPAVGSDSGQGTASNSPSSQKDTSAELGDFKGSGSDAKCAKQSESCRFSNPAVQSSCPTSAEELQVEKATACPTPPLIPPCGDGHCSMWLMGSPDCMVPVCSSFQKEDRVSKERRISVPDILMSWGGCTQPAMDKDLPQDDHQKSSKPEETKNSSVVAESGSVNNVVTSSGDADELFKILRFPCVLIEPFESRKDGEPLESTGSERLSPSYRDELQYSINLSQKLPDNSQEIETNPNDTTEMMPFKMSHSGCRIKRKMNESVWSVESLVPFIPTREWLLQNGMFDPKANEMEEAENLRLLAKSPDWIIKDGPEKIVPVSERWLNFKAQNRMQSPPEMPQMRHEVPEMKQPELDQSLVSLEKDALSSATALLSKTASTPSGENGNGSSEPEANQSPNQESLLVNELPERSHSSPEEETLHLDLAEEMISTDHLLPSNGGNAEVDEGAPDSVLKMAEVSPSKGHLVDCGVQCNGFQDRRCGCEELSGSLGPNRRLPFKYSDVKKPNIVMPETFCMNGTVQRKRNGQWRSRGQDRPGNQQDAFNGFCKPGKSKGANGRNSRY